MKKTCLLLLVLLLTVLLSACVAADLTYTLTDDHTVSLRYRLDFHENDPSLSRYIDQIGSFWADQDMTVAADKDETLLTGEKSVTCESAHQAAEVFSSVFSSKNNLFDDVTFDYTPSFASDSYHLTASIALTDIIRQNIAQDIPADQLAALGKSAEDGTYALSIALPGDVLSTNANEQKGNVCTWKLRYGEVTHISLKTQRENTANLEKHEELQNRKALDGKLITAGIAVAGLSVFVIIVSIIVRRIQHKRASEVRIKHFR